MMYFLFIYFFFYFIFFFYLFFFFFFGAADYSSIFYIFSKPFFIRMSLILIF